MLGCGGAVVFAAAFGPTLDTVGFGAATGIARADPGAAIARPDEATAKPVARFNCSALAGLAAAANPVDVGERFSCTSSVILACGTFRKCLATSPTVRPPIGSSLIRSTTQPSLTPARAAGESGKMLDTTVYLGPSAGWRCASDMPKLRSPGCSSSSTCSCLGSGTAVAFIADDSDRRAHV